MFVDNTLFILMLAAITLVIIVLFGLVANMLIESKQKQKSQLGIIAGASRNTQKCPYSFGYLSLLPRSQPIPDECFGCLLGIDCIKANPKPKPTKKETNNPEKHVTSAALP